MRVKEMFSPDIGYFCLKYEKTIPYIINSLAMGILINLLSDFVSLVTDINPSRISGRRLMTVEDIL